MGDIVKPRSFYYLLHPKLVAIVITKCPNGRINAMPAAWIMPVSEEPPTIAIAIDRESYTFQCLEYCNEASINIPSLQYADVVYRLGTVTGRKVDKIEMFKLALEKSKSISVPIWRDAIGWIEGRIQQYIDVGEVRLYIFEVIVYYAKADAAGEWGWMLNKASPLYHVIGRTFATICKTIRLKT